MVSQRIFQAIQRLRLLLAVLLVSAWIAGEAQAQERSVIDAFIVDLRSGDQAARAPSREAFASALGTHAEIRLAGDKELHALLAGESYSAMLEQGRARVAATAVAYGALDCPGVESLSEQAILDLAAAMTNGASARDELHQVYLYRFLCADRLAQNQRAIAAAAMLRRLGAEPRNADWRPKEISEATWSRYPLPGAESPKSEAFVTIESEPSGASLWVDYQETGVTPDRVLLSHGQHIVALGSKQGGVSQEIIVSGPGMVRLSLPTVESQWVGMADLVEQLQTKTTPKSLEESMGNLMTAIEAQAAFVMREPGRVSVWVWRPETKRAEHVGHAPNANIAGNLVLQALHEHSIPGLTPNIALLLEEDESETRSTSNKRWWVYGVVLGAAAIGAGFIIAQDLSEDRQHIEVTLP